MKSARLAHWNPLIREGLKARFTTTKDRIIKNSEKSTSARYSPSGKQWNRPCRLDAHYAAYSREALDQAPYDSPCL